MIEFPYYSANIKLSQALGKISFDDFISLQKNPSEDKLKIFKDIEVARSKSDKKLVASLKTKLKAFTPCVQIERGMARKYANVKAFTGFMQIDLDKIPTEQDALDLKEHIFHNYPEIVCSYLSPSRRGVKALLRIKKPIIAGELYTVENAIRSYKKLHEAVSREFVQYKYFDKATKNPILPLFQSFDPDLLSRPFQEALEWDIEYWFEEEKKKLNDIPSYSLSNDNYYYKKTVRLVEEKINGIVDNGHPQVRRASLILGSRVGAGYIDMFEAEQIIENLISRNAYLQKDLKGYIKTSKWGIENGMKNPKFY